MAIAARVVQRLVRRRLESDGDDEFRASANAQRGKGFGWRFDGLGDWSTEQIFAKLAALGVDTDAERFRAQAESAASHTKLARRWGRALPPGQGLWEDFPYLAVEELWRRLTPELLCPEAVAARIEEAIDSLPVDQPPPGPTAEEQAAVRFLVDYLEGFAPEKRAARFEQVQAVTEYDISPWVLDSAGFGDDARLDEATRVARVMAEANADYASFFMGCLASALARAGRAEAALEQLAANIERFPDDDWIALRSAEAYVKLGRRDEAMKLCVGHMARTTAGLTWQQAHDLLVVLFDGNAEHAELLEIVRRHPKPASPLGEKFRPAARDDSADSGWSSEEDDSVEPFVRTERKIGRNDPCPCGSGKKYKKCCLGRDRR